jgi:putative transposase
VKRPSFLTIDWILSQFDGRRRVAMEKYRRFVMEGIDKESPWERLKGQIFYGTDEFIKGLSGLLDEKGKIKEVPRLQRYAARPSLSELFNGKKGKERKVEDKTIYAAYVRYGYTMKEIAEHLGFHYATISRAMKRVEQG